MWTAVSVAGVALELGGLGIALSGVDQLGRDLSLGHVVPHRRALQWLRQRRLARWLGLGPKPITIPIDSAAMELEAARSIHPYKTKPHPSDAAPHSEWVEYWDSRLGNLSDQLAWLKEDMKEADNDLAKRLKAEAAERQTAHAELSERLKVLVGGEGGSGLVRTWVGLAITMVGVLLSGLAQLFA
jgi:hypothetical protein